MKIHYFIKFVLILISNTFVYLSVLAQNNDVVNGGSDNGLVGSINGTYDVNSNGQFIYEIPISVVSGTGGVSPKLSISYNSGNGNGLFGYGFDLGGLSVISRSPRNLYNDNIADVIRFTPQDRFSLDGQRLQFLRMVNGLMEYRTESDTYSKIVATGSTTNPSKFTVYTKHGLIYEYEPTDLTGKSLFWPLKKVSDTNGNYYTITYDISNNEYVPTEIKYTGNAKASQQPFATISFSYQNINRSPSFIGGVKFNRCKAINKITIKYKNEDVKYYELTYTSKKGKLFLNKLTEKSRTDKFNPTKFNWDNSELYDVKQTSYKSFSDFHDVNVKTGDFNGDGKRDLLTWANNKNEYKFKVYLNNGNGFDNPISYTHDLSKVVGNSHKTLYGVAVGDFNGDGYDDIAIARQNAGLCYYLDYCETELTSSDVIFRFKKTVTAPVMMQHKMMVTDINCDGVSDILMVNANYYGNTYYSLMSKSTDTSVEPLVLTKSGKVENDGFINTFFIDLDGDGTMELLNVWDSKSGKAGSCLYKISKEGELSRIIYLTLGGEDYYIVGDFNGDGKTDIITTGNEKNAIWEMNFAQGVLDGSSLFFSKTFTKSYFNQKDKTVYGEDINGDGLSDFVVIDKKNNKNLEFWINKGTGMEFEKHVCQTIPGTDERRYLMDDFNGDGKLDLMSYRKRGDSTVGFDIFSMTNTSKDMLTCITDGMGNTIMVSYKNLTDGCMFKHGNTHSYPLVSVGNPWPVVYSVTTPNSTYGKHTVTYSYENAIYHKRGRGMLGFEKFIAEDNLTHIRTENTFDINKEVMMPMLKSTRTTLQGILICKTDYEYELSFHHNGANRKEWIYSCLPKKIEERKYEYNSREEISHTIKTNEYDKYGNVTINSIECGGRVIKTTNSYNNDESKWHLGRLTHAFVEKSDGNKYITIESAFEYDSNTGLLKKEVYAPNNPQGYVKTYTYDLFGNVKSSTKTPNDGSLPTNLLTTYTQDGRFKKESTNSLGYKSTFIVDPALGVENSNTDINGITTTSEYNSLGQPLGSYNSINNTKMVMAWSKGHTYAPTSALYYIKTETKGKPTVWEFFDFLGQLLRKATVSLNGDIVYVDTRYDERGRVVAVSEPYWKGTQEIIWNYTKYDDADRVVETKNASGAVTRISYNGLVTKITDTRGNISPKKINELNELVECIDSQGSFIRYKYDVCGNCIETRGPRTTIKCEYDNFGNRTKLIDPDLGTISFKYDSNRRLVSRIDSKGETTYTYDKAGRLLKEIRPDYTYTYVYDTRWKGTVSSEICSNGTSIEHFYDGYGRKNRTTEIIDGNSYITMFEYDSDVDRISAMTYPSGFKIGYTYSPNGYLKYIYDTNTNMTIWSAVDTDTKGFISEEKFGEILSVSTNRDPSGNICKISSSPIGMSLSYAYDGNNNLVLKENKTNGLVREYQYDSLNRLTKVFRKNNGRNNLEMEMQYDAAGNIIYKTGIGQIQYIDGTNRISSISGQDYELPVWDEINYSSFNKIESVKTDYSNGQFVKYNKMELTYGPDKERKVQNIYRFSRPRHDGNPSQKHVFNILKKYYVGNYYERSIKGENEIEEELNYIYAGDQAVAYYETKENVSRYIFLLHDNIGSIIGSVDSDGNLISNRDFDPWGRDLNAKSDSYMEDNSGADISDKGFTGHEHIDLFGMINMGGRMYDSYIGRFLTPDPFVQAPDFSQSLNRYAYCLNNPLSLTDPTGYNWIGDAFCAIVGIAVGVETAGLGTGIWGTLIGGACGGASSALASSLINGANLWQTTKSTLLGGFWGAASGAANFGIGEMTGDFWSNVALHSVSDGTMEALQGGHFEHGLLVGMASSASGQGLMRYCYNMPTAGKLIATTVVGGTVSVLGGGKFANGAMTAAFSFMYNETQHTFGPENVDKLYESYLDISYKTVGDKEIWMDPYELAKKIGGDVYTALSKVKDLNGCALRLSAALNEAGFEIPVVYQASIKGGDGKNYIVNAAKMYKYLKRHYGGAIKIYNNHSNVPSGIPFIDGNGVFENASGHVDVVKNYNWGSQGRTNYSHKYYKITTGENKPEIFCKAYVIR